jgi:hypothetical protein
MALERTNSWGNQTELYIIRVCMYIAREKRDSCVGSALSRDKVSRCLEFEHRRGLSNLVLEILPYSEGGIIDLEL